MEAFERIEAQPAPGLEICMRLIRNKDIFDADFFTEYESAIQEEIQERIEQAKQGILANNKELKDMIKGGVKIDESVSTPIAVFVPSQGSIHIIADGPAIDLKQPMKLIKIPDELAFRERFHTQV